MPITTLNKVKTILTLDDSKDALIEELIPLVEDDYEQIRNKPFEEDSEGNTVYPLGAELTAIDMIGYKLASDYRSHGIQSESLSRHSVTYDTTNMLGGYPRSITGRIKRYVRFV
ncbi:hypothetical protein BHU72_11995 [Desulfuribacillus stibiiarsenatis]|uniref:Phage gp6-like head-tail connector protein n=1 Tax=Desulfuribacillus stibiiarsenatis TaxID=1390249 RepID=A0A1E5L8D6_9FIRM|nr:hypothetical protein [Desulfuribacillus stibiiarsenatis]OEH86249.1 hypothetical protein BHU72_11995 [Desulfuribacillus stibiiarsenatis]